MFEVVTIKDKEGFLVLFTQDDSHKCMSLLKEVRGERQQVGSQEELREALAGTGFTPVPLFDFTGSFTGVRRNIRFVRRIGKAKFPFWIPPSIQAGMRVYSTATPVTEASLQQFRHWLELPARPPKPGKRERASRRSDRHGSLWL